MSPFSQDFRLAARLFFRVPLFAASAVLSLALGVGLLTAVFSIFDSYFLARVTGVAHPDRVVFIAGEGTFGARSMPISYPDYLDLCAASKTFSAIAAYQDIRPSLTLYGASEVITGQVVTSNFFSVLGVRILLGRTFLPEDDHTDPHIVILSHSLWQHRFTEDPRVIGRTVLVNKTPFTIIGVAAKEFTGFDAVVQPQLWVPLAAYDDISSFADRLPQRDQRTLLLLGRLSPARSLNQARAELRSIAERLTKENPSDSDGRGMSLTALNTRIAPAAGSMLRKSTFLLLASSLTFLLSACGNIAVVALVKTLAQHRETTLRLALGISRRQLLRHLLNDVLLFNLLGGSMALLVALGLTNALTRLAFPILPGIAERNLLGSREFVLAFLLSSLVSSLFVFIPILRTFGGRSLRIDAIGRPADLSPRIRFLCRCLIGFQALLCTASLTCTGTFAVNLARLQRLDHGVETAHLFFTPLDLKSLGYGEKRGRSLQANLLAGLRGSPEIRFAALAENRVLSAFRVWRDVSLVQVPSPSEKYPIASDVVSQGYFQTIGLPILRGRPFDDRDRPEAPPTAIVSERLAHFLWTSRDPLGRPLYLDGEAFPVEVIGVVRDIRTLRASDTLNGILYLPLGQRYDARTTLHVRPAGPTSQAVFRVRTTMRQLGIDLQSREFGSIAEAIQHALQLPRIHTLALTLLSYLALTLTTVGVFGMSFYFSHLRQREAGIRLALGADLRQLVASLVGREILWTLVGILAGIAVARIALRRLDNFLTTSQRDLIASALGAGLLMFFAVLVAILIPAFRVIRSNPARSLQA